MKKIFKNMVPYWYLIIIILFLLVIQAYGDLSLPQYTSDIIDVGIQNKGIEHILPERMTADEYEQTAMFMTDQEKEIFAGSYEQDKDGYYERTVNEQKKLNKLDAELLTPIVMTYKMANMSETDFRTMMSEAMQQNEKTKDMAKLLEKMSLKDIMKFMNTDLRTYEAEDTDGNMVTYVDIRPLIQKMMESGQMTDETMQKSREMLEKMTETIGANTLKSMGAAYAIACDTDAGVDIDKIQIDYLWAAGGRMFIIAFVMLAAAAGTGYLASRVGAGVGRKLRSRIFERVVSFSNAEMDRFSTASLITRSTNDIQQVQMVTAILLRMILYAPIIGIGGIYKVYQTGAGMGWIIGLAVLVIAAFVMVLVAIAMPKFKIMQKLVDDLNLVSREILTGLSVIRAFGREETEEQRFDKANRNLTKTQLFTNRVMTFMMPGMTMIMYCVVLLIVWVAAHKIDSGNLQVGAMTAFITYAMQIVMSFLMLTMLSIMLPRAGVAADRIEEVLTTDTTIKEPETPAAIKEHKGVLKFSHVDFRYPGAEENVLDDIDFEVLPGKTTAIIGSTGCGKSTLVSLIPRFYDVTGGSITLDGLDIRNIALKELRDEIGYVPQKGILFSGTVATNLRFGCPDAADEDIREAARIAQASEFIEGKGDGYDSLISQGGTNVSGGQKQRLAIARAIAKHPRLFVFDDSFSALDMKTDAALRKALEESVKDASVLIVAQRISTIVHADQILVLDDGKIVGKGTHEELLKNCDVYRQIAGSQLSERELGIAEGKEDSADEQ